MTETERMQAAMARVVVDGVEYVPRSLIDAERDEADRLKRTLAMAHMHLEFGEPGRALRRITADVGWTREDARAIRDIVTAARDGLLTDHPTDTTQETNHG